MPADYSISIFASSSLAERTPPVFANAQENQYADSYTYQFFPPGTYGARLEVIW